MTIINNLDPRVRDVLPKKHFSFRGKPRGIKPFGYRPAIKNNVFSQAFDGSKSVKHILLNQSSQSIKFSCNRYADGLFLEKTINGKDVLGGIDHIMDNCAEFSKL